MGKLSISSGSISLNDLRTHFGDTNSISMADFRSGGNKSITGLDPYSYTGAKYVNNANEQTYWRIRTIQTATGSNGSGTVTTQSLIFIHVGGIGGISGSFGTLGQIVSTPLSYWTTTGDDNNIDHRGEYPIGRSDGYVTRGTLQSAGSYGSWTDNLGFKDVFLNSQRTKDDYYQIVFYDISTRLQVSNINSGVPQSGSIGLDDLYEIDDGVIWSGTINAGDSGGSYSGRGFRSTSTTPYGSLASGTSANVDPIEGLIQPQGQMQLTEAQQEYYDANKRLKIIIEAPLRTTAAGTISNTSTSNISRGRFGNAFNHTGYGHTDTTAVWTRPDELISYNNYDKRNVDWGSTQVNGTRRDDGHSGWLLPTAGPTLLQVRAESENGNAVLNSVRFTPNSSWRGKVVVVQALRTRQAGGISNFSCSGAASGNFSNLSNSNGAPINRYVTLPSSGYITLSANSTGSYTGTNRIVQISVFDPFLDGMARDRAFIGKVYVNGSEVFDASVDSYQSIQFQGTSTQMFQRMILQILDIGVDIPSSGTFTMELRR